jgi:hypothetical protein
MPVPTYAHMHCWARNLKNVGRATLKMLCCKSKTQFVKQERDTQKRNPAFELFKAHCAAKINAKNVSFHKN